MQHPVDAKMEKWSGKVAIVTGASSGIGMAIAEKLVEHGINVVGLARRFERVEQLSKKLTGKKGKLYAIKCDVSKEGDILGTFKKIKENFGVIHILVNNAGVLRASRFIDTPTQNWRDLFDINVIGLSICTREFLNQALQNKISGHVFIISSVVGNYVPRFKKSFMNLYPATKHALKALAEQLRHELVTLKPRTKLTTICPGLTETEIVDQNMDNFSGNVTIKSEDIADGVIYALGTRPEVQIEQIIIRPVDELF